MLKFSQISALYKNEKIVDRVSFSVKKGEIVILMGQNGSGKSTFAHAVMGNPLYELGNNSKITVDATDITHMKTEEKAQAGLFLAFQNPIAIPGVSVTKLLREIKGASVGGTLLKTVRAYSEKFHFSPDLLSRGINDGFSGGEKKKIEMMQACFLANKYVLFDEIDTGLDADALRFIAESINDLKRNGIGCIVITHYQRLVDYLAVDRVLIMHKGHLIAEGKKELAHDVEKKGYEKIVNSKTTNKKK